jgi:hypothetical protein
MNDDKIDLGPDGELKTPISDAPKAKRQSEKSKRGGSRFIQYLQTLLFRAIFIFLAGLLVMFAVKILSDKRPAAVASSGEVLTIPFNRYESTLTTQKYSGTITLTISGTGQAGGNSYSDAFYLYTEENGQPRTPPMTEAFDLEIDGQRAIIALGLRQNPPPYSTSHVYQVTYNVGSTPRQIAFRISDLIVTDNRGSFTVKISSAK